MFTVKHRESPALGGNEFIYSAETIEVVYPAIPTAGNADLDRLRHGRWQFDPATARVVEAEPVLAGAQAAGVAQADMASLQRQAGRLGPVEAAGRQIHAERTFDEEWRRLNGLNITTDGQTVSVEPVPTSTSNYFESGIFLDREPEPGPGEDRTRFSKQIILFGSDATHASLNRRGGKVWVMNEAGATVATYDL